jgi:hypothetical protein
MDSTGWLPLLGEIKTMIQSAAQFLVADVVIMGIIVIAGIAFILEFAIRCLERAFVPWARREQAYLESRWCRSLFCIVDLFRRHSSLAAATEESPTNDDRLFRVSQLRCQ